MKTREEQKHINTCSAPICMCDTDISNKKSVIWYAGERICNWVPTSIVQRRQLSINNLFHIGRFRTPERPYTEEYLVKRAV